MLAASFNTLDDGVSSMRASDSVSADSDELAGKSFDGNPIPCDLHAAAHNASEKFYTDKKEGTNDREQGTDLQPSSPFAQRADL